jgi:hypothetical protein
MQPPKRPKNQELETHVHKPNWKRISSTEMAQEYLIYWSIRHYRGWQFIPLVFFVLVLVLSETVLVLEGMLRDFVDKRAKY